MVYPLPDSPSTPHPHSDLLSGAFEEQKHFKGLWVFVCFPSRASSKPRNHLPFPRSSIQKLPRLSTSILLPAEGKAAPWGCWGSPLALLFSNTPFPSLFLCFTVARPIRSFVIEFLLTFSFRFFSLKQAAESSRGVSSATKASAVGSLQDSEVQEDPLGDAPKKMVICSPRKYDGASFRPTFPTRRLRIKQKRHELVCFVCAREEKTPRASPHGVLSPWSCSPPKGTR